MKRKKRCKVTIGDGETVSRCGREAVANGVCHFHRELVEAKRPKRKRAK